VDTARGLVGWAVRQAGWVPPQFREELVGAAWESIARHGEWPIAVLRDVQDERRRLIGRKVGKTTDLWSELGHDDEDFDPGHVDSGFDQVDDRDVVDRVLASLPTRRRWVFEQRFAIGRSLADIGAEMGVSQSRVCQLVTRTVRELR
jgi:RNA polymerase sigma factor (sigma-70 family)